MKISYHNVLANKPEGYDPTMDLAFVTLLSGSFEESILCQMATRKGFPDVWVKIPTHFTERPLAIAGKKEGE